MASAIGRPRARLGRVPWAPIAVGLVAIIATAVWYHYASLALRDTATIAALIGIPTPKPFTSLLPVLLALSIAFVVLLSVAAVGLFAWRGAQRQPLAGRAGRRAGAPGKPLLVSTGVLSGLTYGLAVWFAFMLGLSLLWFGGGLVAAHATADAVAVMEVVDETLPRLITAAQPGVDPKEGYEINVAGRFVDIGSSSCSLFCFTLARALMAPSINCTCDTALAQRLLRPGATTPDIPSPASCAAVPVMCAVNGQAHALYREHMLPALAAVIVALLAVLGLLCLASGSFARVLAERRAATAGGGGGSSDGISRCSSADADMRVGGSDEGSPRKDGAKSVEIC